MSFEDFQYGRSGGHLGYQNKTILAILNLYVTRMQFIKFQPIRFTIQEATLFKDFQYDRQDDHLRYQVSVQSDLWFWRRC